MLGPMFQALQSRNYRLYFVGLLISWIGSWMQRTALGWLVYELTGSQVLLGVVAAAVSAPIVLLSPWAGAFADRWSKRRLLTITQLWLMTLGLTLGALVWLELVRPGLLLLIAALEGVAMAFDMPARQAFLPEAAGRENLANAVALNSSIVNAARIVGPSLAGIVMARFGMALCFFLNGLSFLAVVAALMRMELSSKAKPRKGEAGWQRLRGGFAYVRQSRKLREAFGIFAVVGVFGWSYGVLMPVYAKDALSVAEEGYGLLLSANGMGALVGALTVARLVSLWGPERLRAIGISVFAVGLALLAGAKSYGLAAAILFGTGWGQMLFLSSTSAQVQLNVSEEVRGRVMGIWTAVFASAMPVGGLLAGFFCSRFGIQAVFLGGAAACAAAAWAAVQAARRARPRALTPAS